MPTPLLTVREALDAILSQVSPLPAERVPLWEALGQVLAEEVRSPQDIPPFTNSAMDGYAVRWREVSQASASQPVRLTVVGQIAAGDAPTWGVPAGAAARIMTGAPMPEGADTVVRFEVTRQHGAEVSILAAPTLGENVRVAGEDVQAGAVALSRETVIRPAVVGVLASLGVAEVVCHRRPRVAILSTGDELVGLDEPLTPGKIRNSNEYTLTALVEEAGGIPVRLGIARDQAEHLRTKITEGIDQGADLFLTSAGVSVGDYDFVKTVLAEEGVVHFWQVAIKPGKPLAFGRVQGVPLLGLPGNPVAAAVAFEAFARPAIFKLLGRDTATRVTLTAALAEDIENSGRRHYMRAWVWREGDQFRVTTRGHGVTVQGSGILTSLVWANCLLIVPEDVTLLKAGSTVDIHLLTDTLAS